MKRSDCENGESTVAKRTIEIYDCDLCGKPGFHYTVTTPEGLLSLDRCEEHAKTILDLKHEEGAKLHRGRRKTSSETSLEDIYSKMRQ